MEKHETLFIHHLLLTCKAGYSIFSFEKSERRSGRYWKLHWLSYRGKSTLLQGQILTNLDSYSGCNTY